jgi:hypothetical protein
MKETLGEVTLTPCSGEAIYDKNPEKTDAGADLHCVEGLGLQVAPAEL